MDIEDLFWVDKTHTEFESLENSQQELQEVLKSRRVLRLIRNIKVSINNNETIVRVQQDKPLSSNIHINEATSKPEVLNPQQPPQKASAMSSDYDSFGSRIQEQQKQQQIRVRKQSGIRIMSRNNPILQTVPQALIQSDLPYQHKTNFSQSEVQKSQECLRKQNKARVQARTQMAVYGDDDQELSKEKPQIIKITPTLSHHKIESLSQPLKQLKKAVTHRYRYSNEKQIPTINRQPDSPESTNGLRISGDVGGSSLRSHQKLRNFQRSSSNKALLDQQNARLYKIYGGQKNTNEVVRSFPHLSYLGKDSVQKSPKKRFLNVESSKKTESSRNFNKNLKLVSLTENLNNKNNPEQHRKRTPIMSSCERAGLIYLQNSSPVSKQISSPNKRQLRPLTTVDGPIQILTSQNQQHELSDNYIYRRQSENKASERHQGFSRNTFTKNLTTNSTNPDSFGALKRRSQFMQQLSSAYKLHTEELLEALGNKYLKHSPDQVFNQNASYYQEEEAHQAYFKRPQQQLLPSLTT